MTPFPKKREQGKKREEKGVTDRQINRQTEEKGKIGENRGKSVRKISSPLGAKRFRAIS